MTAFWQGQRPWSPFEQLPVWDAAGDDVAARASEHAPASPARSESGDAPAEVDFVQHAIQASYDR